MFDLNELQQQMLLALIDLYKGQAEKKEAAMMQQQMMMEGIGQNQGGEPQ